MTIGETEIYYIGERNVGYDDTHETKEGDKKVIYLLKNGEVAGMITIGFTNLHIYLREAMRLLLIPNGQDLRMRDISHKDIVMMVLKHSGKIIAERHDVINQKSILYSVKSSDVDETASLRSKMGQNLKEEKDRVKQKFEQ